MSSMVQTESPTVAALIVRIRSSKIFLPKLKQVCCLQKAGLPATGVLPQVIFKGRTVCDHLAWDTEVHGKSNGTFTDGTISVILYINCKSHCVTYM